jgi:hypothetical protein
VFPTGPCALLLYVNWSIVSVKHKRIVSGN